MRIAFFTDTYYPEVNGIVTSILNTTDKLARRGHKIIIFCPRYKDKKENKRHRNITVRRCLAAHLPTYSDVQIAMPNQLSILKELKRFKPDIIHMHTPGVLSTSAIISSKMLRKPLVGTFHTLVTEQLDYISIRKIIMNKYLKGFLAQHKKINSMLLKIKGSSPENIDRNIRSLNRQGKHAETESKRLKVSRYISKMIKKESEWNTKTKKRLVWKLLRTVYGECDLITTPSPRLVKELKKQMGKNRIKYISNGLDFSLFRRKKTSAHHKRIISVGRVSYEKNVDIIVKSMPYVLKRHPSATLTIVGDGPALPGLKELASKLGIKNSVKFAGMVKYSEISDWYCRSDIFATASTMETQGLTILEAMYCGLPVVGVRKYAIPDWVKENKNGHIVPPGKPDRMGAAITDILNKPKTAEKYGSEAAKDAEEHDIKLIIPKLERLYSSLLTERAT